MLYLFTKELLPALRCLREFSSQAEACCQTRIPVILIPVEVCCFSEPCFFTTKRFNIPSYPLDRGGVGEPFAHGAGNCCELLARSRSLRFSQSLHSDAVHCLICLLPSGAVSFRHLSSNSARSITSQEVVRGFPPNLQDSSSHPTRHLRQAPRI